jgi:hypothetical protein
MTTEESLLKSIEDRCARMKAGEDRPLNTLAGLQDYAGKRAQEAEDKAKAELLKLQKVAVAAQALWPSCPPSSLDLPVSKHVQELWDDLQQALAEAGYGVEEWT